MVTIYFLYSLIVGSLTQQQEECFYGKTFFYEIYCKKRDGFYSVELKGPKYYSIEVLPISYNLTDTLPYNTYQSIVRDKKDNIRFSDSRWVKCNLRKIIESDATTQKRLSLFRSFLYLKIHDFTEMPNQEDIAQDFIEYNKTGDIDKTIKKYLSQ